MAQKTLKLIEKEMHEAFPRKIVVFGEGPPDAKIMLVGQNPGEQEEKMGRPFVGRSGKFLNKVLEKNGIRREDVFISNVVRWRTPLNRVPTEKEIEQCMPFLEDQIRAIKPKLVVLMGAIAWKTTRVEGPEYFETYHPSAAMRFNRARLRFHSDFEKVGKIAKNL